MRRSGRRRSRSDRSDHTDSSDSTDHTGHSDRSDRTGATALRTALDRDLGFGPLHRPRGQVTRAGTPAVLMVAAGTGHDGGGRSVRGFRCYGFPGPGCHAAGRGADTER